jgi:flagellar protein FliO/FliZ
MEWILVKTLLSLTAVLGLMVGTVFVLKRFVYRSGPNATSLVSIDVVGQASLHPKRSVVVLKVMNKLLVVGMSEQGMQTLSEITDDASIADIEQRMETRPAESRWLTWRKDTQRESAAGKSFTDHFQRYVQQFVQGRPADTDGSTDASWNVPRKPTGRRSKKRPN